MEYKGELKGFPQEIVERMLECQVEQGNKRDVPIFEEELNIDDGDGGFFWNDTEEGGKFWHDIIINRKFDLFFKKYPRPQEEKSEYPKVMLVSGSVINKNNEGAPRVVFMEKKGKFLAWDNSKTLEESEHSIYATPWNYAKDIPAEEEEQYIMDIKVSYNRLCVQINNITIFTINDIGACSLERSSKVRELYTKWRANGINCNAKTIEFKDYSFSIRNDCILYCHGITIDSHIFDFLKMQPMINCKCDFIQKWESYTPIIH